MVNPDLCDAIVLEVTTADGCVGYGDTSGVAASIESYLHEAIAPRLLGRDARAIAACARVVRPYLGYDGPGVETRTNAALDIALWDMLGRRLGQPLYQLLGGRSRPGVPILEGADRPIRVGDDVWLALAEGAVNRGASAVSWCPPAREQPWTAADIDEFARRVGKVRDQFPSVGLVVDLGGACPPDLLDQFLRLLEPAAPLWVEDAGDVHTRIPIATSGSLGSVVRYREALEARVAEVVRFDIGVAGGITDAQAVATLADSFHLPISPRGSSGPWSYLAAAHLASAATNASLLERLSKPEASWYGAVVSELPALAGDGLILAETPGLGAELCTDALAGVRRRVRETRA